MKMFTFWELNRATELSVGPWFNSANKKWEFYFIFVLLQLPLIYLKKILVKDVHAKQGVILIWLFLG